MGQALPKAFAPLMGQALPKAFATAKALAALMGWATLMGQALPKALATAKALAALTPSVRITVASLFNLHYGGFYLAGLPVVVVWKGARRATGHTTTTGALKISPPRHFKRDDNYEHKNTIY